MEIPFHKKFYLEESIRETIDAYSELAKFSIKEDQNYFIVEIKDINFEQKDLLLNEFKNYALALTINEVNSL